MPVASLEENLGVDTGLDHSRRSPFAGDQGVVAKVPPEIVMKKLRTAINFPFAQDVETFRIENENAARSIAGRRAESADKDSVWSTMNGVRATVAGTGRDGFGLNHFHDFGIARIRLGVDDVDARGTDPRNDQITTLDVGMRSVGTQARTASIPAKVVQFVASIGHVHLTNKLAVCGGRWVDVDHADGVGPSCVSGIQ